MPSDKCDIKVVLAELPFEGTVDGLRTGRLTIPAPAQPIHPSHQPKPSNCPFPFSTRLTLTLAEASSWNWSSW